ncbi:uncharacterized protein C16orf86 homolog [Castor canadensis]|uniref:Uncharacterized protein C16orf86 homolog n=1 Tax=Castor canadensis TaxID=51338 RepID=A0AC58L466_CASCN
MASAGAERQPGAQKGAALGLAQRPVLGDQCLVPGHEACRTPGQDECPNGCSYEPELQEEGPKLEEEGLDPEVEAREERGPRPMAFIVRPSQRPKRKPFKTEAELPPGLLMQREEPEGSQSEPSPSAKQHKKAKKRKSLGAPMVPAVASTASTPPETLGLESLVLPRVFAGKTHRLRPLYQYINYCNPELNLAEEEDREAEMEPESEMALVPEEAGVEQLQALLPMAGELGLGLTLQCPSVLVTPTHALASSLGEEAGEEAGFFSSLRVSGSFKAEMDKSTQVDIDKMLSVCTAPLVPPLSPQYK